MITDVKTYHLSIDKNELLQLKAELKKLTNEYKFLNSKATNYTETNFRKDFPKITELQEKIILIK